MTVHALSSLPSPTSCLLHSSSSHSSLCCSLLSPSGSLLSFLAFAQDASPAEKSICGSPAYDLNAELLTVSPGLSVLPTSHGFFVNYSPEDLEEYHTLLIFLLSGTFNENYTFYVCEDWG